MILNQEKKDSKKNFLSFYISEFFWVFYPQIIQSSQGKTSLPNECPKYDFKSSDREAPVLELWEM